MKTPHRQQRPDYLFVQNLAKNPARPGCDESWWMGVSREQWAAVIAGRVFTDPTPHRGKGRPKGVANAKSPLAVTHCTNCERALTQTEQRKGLVRCFRCRKATPGIQSRRAA